MAINWQAWAKKSWLLNSLSRPWLSFPKVAKPKAGLQSLFAPAPTATPSVTIYMVQRGDTLFSIARRFGSTVDAVKAAKWFGE